MQTKMVTYGYITVTIVTSTNGAWKQNYKVVVAYDTTLVYVHQKSLVKYTC